ncbi:UvrB/UvrC motif-containing protein, partial [Enterococcus faecalis]|nr:UvrB/UvrC motif-containing protein [Enterococcus faecalis]
DKIVHEIKAKMAKASENWEFERAAEYRDILEGISSLRTKQRVIAHDMQDRDVFGYAVDKGWMSVQVFFVRQGKLIERNSQLFPYYGEAEDDFLTFLGQFYQDSQHLMPKEVLLPHTIEAESAQALVSAKVIQPQKGEKKQLVQLAIKNAKVSLQQKFDLLEKDVVKNHGAIEGLGQALGLDKLRRIEAFDNSNIMGTSPVSAMVVFIDGKASKNDYRKYKIKTVQGPDDYASMREVIERRYSRVKREGLAEPDLIIIDGGLGQVNAAKESLKAIGMAHI